MVSLKEIRESNTALKSTLPNPTAFFAGGTSGIGEATLLELAKNTSKPKIYFAARSEATASKLKDKLTKLNAAGEYIYMPVENLSLLKDVDKVCEELKRRETRLDILFLSPGFLNFEGRSETPEGIDRILSIRYYARMRFIYNLLPLLSAAPHPHVVSVLAAGMESKVFESDLALKDHYSFINCAGTSSTMTTLFMERLARENPSIAFVHEYPGFVATPLVTTGATFGPVMRFLLSWIIAPLMKPFMMTPGESGERGLYYATSRTYSAKKDGCETKGSNGVKGSGCYGVGANSDPALNEGVLGPMREKGVDGKIWDHTLGEFDRVVAT